MRINAFAKHPEGATAVKGVEAVGPRIVDFKVAASSERLSVSVIRESP